MLIPLYKIKFADDTEYIGGDIESPNWLLSPDKPIKFIALRLPSGDCLLVSNYEEYLLMVEATDDISATGKEHKIEYLYLMGCTKNTVYSYRINFMVDFNTLGDITFRMFPRGKEWYGKPTIGWKKGNIIK